VPRTPGANPNPGTPAKNTETVWNVDNLCSDQAAAADNYFNDITGNGKLQQAATNNGLYPTTPGYDEATGIGTAKFAAVITSR
jgi:hypothetical protein